MKTKITIGVTVTEVRHENYPAWIKGGDENIEIIELSWTEQNWDEIEDCDGIVLTGGVDVHPEFYDNTRTNYPNAPEEFIKNRDEFEMHVFETALNFDHPVLAICRGMQLINVALGGTLVQDIEETGGKDHQRHNEIDAVHELDIVKGTLLADIVHEEKGTINSAHHQSLDIVAEELIPNCYSPDKIIEGVEWRDKSGKSFLLAVEWHPERMEDKDTNPLSKNIREKFLEEVRKG